MVVRTPTRRSHPPVKPLHLTLHCQWFEAIARGDKREEYRAQSPHWRRMFGSLLPGLPLPWSEIHFRNGYGQNRPWMRVELLGITTGTWEGAPCYVLKLGRILEVKRWPMTHRVSSECPTKASSSPPTAPG